MKTAAAIHQLEVLQVKHQRLETELDGLSRRAYLTPSEEERTRILKKEKLRAKDRIRILMNEVKLA
jgi:hypothetical protein